MVSSWAVLRSVEGGNGLSRNGSMWRYWPIRMRSKMAGRRRYSAYGAGDEGARQPSRCAAEGENRWALVHSDIKSCRTRNNGCDDQRGACEGAALYYATGPRLVWVMSSVGWAMEDAAWETAKRRGELLLRP